MYQPDRPKVLRGQGMARKEAERLVFVHLHFKPVKSYTKLQSFVDYVKKWTLYSASSRAVTIVHDNDVMQN